MPEADERALQSHVIATRVTTDLYHAIAADAAKLGCSMSDAARWRLSSGVCPVMPTGGQRE
jgi:hypothetical protein